MTCCVELTDVQKSFGTTRALAGLSLRAAAGSITAVLGPNGAGKTTAMEICEGLQRPDAGTVRVLGRDPRSDAGALRPRVGVMVQDGGLPVMSRAVELLHHVARLYDQPRDVDELVEALGLAPFARTSVRRLSGGQRQRLALAIALVGRPELVFLDEPSAGLDPQARLAVWDLVRGLRADGVSVVLSTHLMDEAAQLADRVVIIDHGRVLAEGSVPELTRRSASKNTAPDSRTPAPGAIHLTGTITPEARADVEDLATRHGLHLHQNSPTGPSAVGARTLEDVFLELTGRSLR
ncbi:ABC transporter ATP-binding protein [Ruania alba]|uniref:ABC-2 type transport system ATP-binding protein n=1 Tax=Ruania alba TaxID=648782 RepID=A0A1H5EI96_9MICO|nr:ABC transporter ATP-binding protein [Ruania alba]SED90857.1 ABC-2 type transport system ATP-binding protein [Ruania alba]